MQQFHPVDQIHTAPVEPPPLLPESPSLDVQPVEAVDPITTTEPPRERMWPPIPFWRHIMACCGLMCIVTLAFSNSYESGMTLDNKYIIEEYYKSILKSQHDLDLHSWQQIGYLFQNDYWWPKGISGLYRPITTFTYWLDYAVFTKRPYATNRDGSIARDPEGKPILMSWYDYTMTPKRQLNTFSYHTINLLVHWTNGVLLYFVSLLVLKRFWPSALIAALFVAHPITTESVTNIIGRADMFAGIATFGGLLLYVRSSRVSGTRALPWLLALLVLLTFGVFSKESSAALVLVAICYDLVFRWKSDDPAKDGLGRLARYTAMYGLVMILVPLLTSSWADIVLQPAVRFNIAARIGIVMLIMAYGAGQYVFLAFMRPAPREPMLFFAGALIATVFATALWPFVPLVLPVAIGIIELTRYWMRLVREDRFGELPILIGHGLLYLMVAGAMVGMPIVCGMRGHQLGGAGFSPEMRVIAASLLVAIGLAAYAGLSRFNRIIRAASVFGLALTLAVAALVLPFVTVQIAKFPVFAPFLLAPVGAAIALAELMRGSLTSPSDRFKVVAHAALYFAFFFALIALPIAALIAFHRWDLDEWSTGGDQYINAFKVPQWQWYVQGAVEFVGGLFLYYFTLRRERSIRILGLIGVGVALIGASFSSYFLGIVLGVIVATHEVILGSMLPTTEQYRRDWKQIWHGFSIGYLVMIPPLLAMFFVRMWVFSNATPAEEPFLDNPIRGIWQVQALGMKSFEEELAKKPLTGMSFPECKMTAVKVLGKCVYLVSWPWTLCSDYSYDEFPNFSWYMNRWEDWKAIISLCFFLGCGYAAYKLYDRHPAACFFILCFFAAALPTSNLTITIGSVMAERFMYLPLGAFAGIVVILVFRLVQLAFEKLPEDEQTRGILLFSFLSTAGFLAVCVATHQWGGNLYIVWGCRLGVFSIIALALLYLLTESHSEESADPNESVVERFPWLRSAIIVFFFCIVVVYGVRAYDRNFVWQSDLTLWTDAIKTSTRSFRCYQSKAFALYEQDMKGNIDQMISIDETGVPIVDHLPNHLNSSRLYLHLGMFYVLKGEYTLTPNPQGIANNEASASWFTKAINILQRGVEVDRAFNELNHTKQVLRGDAPDSIASAGLSPIYTTQAVAFSKIGRPDLAANRLLYARQLDPTTVESYQKYAMVMVQQGKLEDAVASLIEAIIVGSAEETSDAWSMLPQIVPKMGPEWQNVISIKGNAIQLNNKDPMTRQIITQAYRDMIRGFLRAHRSNLAEIVREKAMIAYDWMTADALDSVFDEPIPEVTPDGVRSDHSIPGPGRPAKHHPIAQ